jgi:hypothetical protein
VTNDAASADRRIRTSFAKQGLMRTLGATLCKVTSGQVEIVLVPKPEVSQQHGFVHAGAISGIADSAAGYSALSMMPMDRGVLTTEFKINFLAPAMGRAHYSSWEGGKSGPHAHPRSDRSICGKGRKGTANRFPTATLMAIQGREGIAD